MAEPEYTTEELQSEIWKEIPGYDGHYSVSNLGRVKRNTATSGRPANRIRRLSHDRDGYLTVSLSVHNRLKSEKVHQLVLRAFIGPRGRRIEVNHKDGKKDNPRLDNLEYVTPAGNRQHGYRMGLYPVGEKHYSAKLTEQQAKEAIRLIENGMSFAAVAKRFHMTLSGIRNIYMGISWKYLARNPRPQKTLSPSNVAHVNRLLASGVSGVEIARQMSAVCGFVVSSSIISRIKMGKTKRFLQPTPEVDSEPQKEPEHDQRNP